MTQGSDPEPGVKPHPAEALLYVSVGWNFTLSDLSHSLRVGRDCGFTPFKQQWSSPRAFLTPVSILTLPVFEPHVTPRPPSLARELRKAPVSPFACGMSCTRG